MSGRERKRSVKQKIRDTRRLLSKVGCARRRRPDSARPLSSLAPGMCCVVREVYVHVASSEVRSSNTCMIDMSTLVCSSRHDSRSLDRRNYW